MQEGLLGSQFECLQFLVEGKAWWQELGEVTLDLLPRSRERERGMLVLRLPSLFIKAKTPVYGMVLLTFRMYLPTTSN